MKTSSITAWLSAHRALAITLFVLVGACDCDNKIRKAVSDGGDRRGDKGADPSGQPISSDPTEVEPNDSASSATPVELGAELRSVLAEIKTRADRDHYTLSARQDALLELTVDPEGEDLDPAIILSIGGHSIRYDIASAGEPETIPILAVGSRALSISVEAKAGAGKYALRFKKRLSGGLIEAEPNDRPAFATPLQAPTEIQGFHDREGDRDIYHLLFPEVLEGEVAVYSVQVEAARDLTHDVALALTSAGEPIYTAKLLPEAKAIFPNLAITSARADVWLRLASAKGYSRENPYQIKIERVAAPRGGGVLDAEPNDAATMAQSLSMVANEPVKVAGFFHHPEDEDHFTLVLGEPAEAPGDTTPAPPIEDGPPARVEDLFEEGSETPPGEDFPPLPVKKAPAHSLELRVEPVVKDLELVMKWGAPGEERVHRASAAGGAIELCNVPLEDGVYPFSISPRALDATRTGHEPMYRIIARDLTASPADGREIEPNDTLDAPDPLLLGRPIKGFMAASTDRDVYALDVLEGAGEDGVLPATTIKVAGHPLDLVLKVYDGQRIMLAQQDTGGAGRPEQFSFRLPPGRYFVEISAKLGSSCEPYELSATR